jgi:predicted transcriptional regulator of viral defense system
MKRKSTYNYLENYLTEVQSKGRYSVTLNELKTKFDISEKAILQKIFRLKNKNILAQVRKEFYVIIPPQYSNRGMLPPTLFINDLMDFLNREYYVGLFSAAALHGAGHQQPMEFQIMTQKPAFRSIKNQKLTINFFTKSEWQQNQIIEKKTEAGYLKVSSPELTAFDLVQYHKRIGGLNRILPILEDLAETMKPSLLSKTAKTQKKTNIQRLGFLLDTIGSESLAGSLFGLLSENSKETPLSLAHNGKTGAVNEKWKIIKNTELDF